MPPQGAAEVAPAAFRESGAGLALGDQVHGASRTGLGQLGGRLDAGQAASDDGQRAAGVLGAGVQEDRVLVGGHRRGVRGGSGDGGGVGRAAQRVHEGVVGEDVRRGVDPDGTGRGVDGGHPGDGQLDARTGEERAQGEVTELPARGELVQPDPLDEPVRRVDQGDAHAAVTPQPTGGALRRDQSGVAGSQNHEVMSHAF